jgi:hypothetical protein
MCRARPRASTRGTTRREGERIHTKVEADYQRVLQQRAISTRWADETFLFREGLKEDLDLMVCNTDMSLFDAL